MSKGLIKILIFVNFKRYSQVKHINSWLCEFLLTGFVVVGEKKVTDLSYPEYQGSNPFI